MNVARIDASGTVVNIEVADAEWIAVNQGVEGFAFVESTDVNPAWIGGLFDKVSGLFSTPVVQDLTSVEAL